MLLPKLRNLALFYLNEQSQEELKKLVYESFSSVTNIFTYEKHGWWYCVSVLFKKISLSIFFFEINGKLFSIQLVSLSEN